MLANNITQAQAFCIASACLQVPVSRLISSKAHIGQQFFSRSANLIRAFSEPLSNIGLRRNTKESTLPHFLIAQHRIRSSRKRREALSDTVDAHPRLLPESANVPLAFADEHRLKPATVPETETEPVFGEPTQLERESHHSSGINAHPNSSNIHLFPAQNHHYWTTNSLMMNRMFKLSPLQRYADRKLYAYHLIARNLINLIHSTRLAPRDRFHNL